MKLPTNFGEQGFRGMLEQAKAAMEDGLTKERKGRRETSDSSEGRAADPPTPQSSMQALAASREEIARRMQVINAVRQAVRSGTTIKLPLPGELAASPYSGTVADYTYEFEGEEDLLHLSVIRQDGGPITAEEGQSVASFLLEGVPPGLVWIRPGETSQHFFLGHDDLLQHVR